MTHDPRYELFGYFDQPFDLTKLRQTQQLVGPGMVQACGDLFVGDKRRQLLDHVSLFALTCGAGKTILMVATLFAVCHEISKRMEDAPRPQRGLWFCKDRALCIQLKAELAEQITKFGLCNVPPDSQICDESGDLDKPPGQHVITISCPHALWGRTNQQRSDERIMEVLAHYDFIIWDECDFAVDQIDRLIKLAPHALKFGLSAANIDAAGTVLQRFFVLAGVASHRFVFQHDHCLRPLLDWEEAKREHYIKPISHDGFARWEKADLVQGQGQHGERHSLPGAMATIRAAIKEARQLEFEMRNDPEWKDQWYSPHIAVYCSTREEAVDLCEQTNIELRHDTSYSTDDGWSATYVISDEKEFAKKKGQTIPKSEQRLFHKDRDVVNPFMRAKDFNGRCDRACKRIIFLVDIGVRGINNWPLAFVVDLKRSGSVSEQVQTLGRLSRLPERLIGMHEHVDFTYYCHPRWYFPQAGLDDVGKIKEAWAFVTEMDSRLEAAGLYHWRDLLDGREPIKSDHQQTPAAPFTMVDRLRIDAELGRLRIEGREPTPDDVERIIKELPGQHSKDRDNFARDHIKHVLTDPDYRRRQIDLSIKPEHIIRPIAMEQPKNASAYTLEELISFLLHDDDLDQATAMLNVEKLKTDPGFRDYVASQKRKEDKRLFRQVPKLRCLQDEDGQPGVISEQRNDLYSELFKAQMVTYEQFSFVSRGVNIAVSELCGMKETCTHNNGPLDLPGYHYEFIIPSNKRRIKEWAVAWLIRKGAISNLGELYRDVM